MKPSNVLILPGWQNSGPDHWQSRWERAWGFQRVEQHDWERPLRGDWIARLEDVLLGCDEPAVLVAHSLGCIHVAAWAAHSRHTHLVKAALLVAAPDVERDDLRTILPSWSPVPLQRLPFKTLQLASTDDPFCSSARAQVFADAWGAEWSEVGAHGHLNTESALGDWPPGFAHLQRLLRLDVPAPATPGSPSRDLSHHIQKN